MSFNFLVLTNIIIVTLLQNKLILADVEDTHNVAKRMDLESCIGRFDVQRDTIIRTDESRAMGAKFLDNADLGSREECLRLCCETDGCDVFVFEEKSQGTCFLFQCGPPENFRCKFIRHANYTSAVLTPSRQVISPPTLQPQSLPHYKIPTKKPVVIELSQHELELDSLKKGKYLIQESPATTTTLIPPLGVRLPERLTTHVLPTPPTRCKRFQFQCHSGECIAVYNACDGIPQCVDGSDEGAECPATLTTTKMPPQIFPRKNSNTETARDLMMGTIPEIIQKQEINPPQIQQTYQEIQRNREDPMSAPQWPSVHQTINSGQSYIEPDSHIFSHKGGLQVPNNPNNNNNIAPQYPALIHETNYIPANGYQVDAYRNSINSQQQWLPDHRITQSRQDWPQQPDLQQEMQPVLPQIRPDWPVRQMPPIQIQEKQPATIPEKMIPKKIDESTSVEEPDVYDEEDESKPTEPPKKKQRKHKNKLRENKKHGKEANDEKPMHEQLQMIRKDLDMEFADHDGAAERPGGAVLSLTLGIIVTAALAILVGCRMRGVGRRVRRTGKSPYAHDADFLVNGMYL